MRLIDADKLLRDIEDYHLSDGMFQHWVEIQNTIEPERKKGKWLRSGNCIFPYECDRCGDTNERATPFCPNCGADMRSEAREYLEYGKLIAKGIAQGLRGEQDG